MSSRTTHVPSGRGEPGWRAEEHVRPEYDSGPRSLELLSVVAPVYNEEATVDEFYSRVCGALDGLAFELVLVD